jgi:hypothetical protein
MTGASYRWLATLGIFMGAVSTTLTGVTIFRPHALDLRLSFGVSLASLFLHPDRPEEAPPLNHPCVGYVAVAMTAWPCLVGMGLMWFLRLAPD